MPELSPQTSFRTLCSGGTRHGTSPAAILLVENINSTSLSEIQDSRDVSRLGRCPNAIVHNKREDSDLLRSLNLDKKLS